MLKWLFLIAFVISGSILGYFYVALKNTESSVAILPPAPPANAVRIAHSYQDGIHRYTGYIKLPHSCFSVNTEIVQDQKFPELLVLLLTTKDNLAQEGFCSQISTRYPFEIIAEAPKSATVTLRVNGKDRSSYLVETNWVSPSGTIIAK